MWMVQAAVQTLPHALPLVLERYLGQPQAAAAEWQRV